MTEVAEVAVEEDTLTNDLAAAWDASENDDGIEQQGGEVHEPSGESSDPAKLDGSESGDDKDKSGDSEKWIRSGEEDADAVNQLATESEKPPVGLSLEAREVWKDVPDAVKADIVKREKDYERGIVQYSQQAKRAQGMDKALAPYQQYLQMNGGAGQTLQNLLQTGSGLQMGSPVQKAQIVANLIKQYGVDIKSLDNMLVGEAPPAEVQQQTQVQQAVQQAVAPYQQFMQQQAQQQQYHQQQAQGVVAQEVNQFGTQNEFYNDVRGDMADLLDMAANRGREMSMDEAYNLACSNHPQISKIVSGRASQQSVDQKRQAASSISGSPGGTMTGAAPNSMIAALNDAWDNAGRM